MMQEPNATLATWLRTTRTEAGLTQVLLAEKAGIESRTIIKIESGQGKESIVLQIQFGAMKTICRNPRSTHCVLFRQFLECRYPFGRVR